MTIDPERVATFVSDTRASLRKKSSCGNLRLTEMLPARISATEPPPGTIGLFWLGQAGFALRGDGVTVLIDPFLSPRPDRLVAAPAVAEDLAFADLVLATHEHRDHLDLPSWPALASGTARFVVPRPLVDRAAAVVGPERVIGAAPGLVLELGRVRVSPVPARHGVTIGDAYAFGLLPGEYRYLGYVVELNGVRVYHAGDTIGYEGLAGRLRELAVEIALLPINGRDAEREARGLVGNLTPGEAADLAAASGARILVPMHYELIAGNTQPPGALLDVVSREHPELTVLALGRYDGVICGPFARGPRNRG